MLVCGASDGGNDKANIMAGMGIREACREVRQNEVPLGGMRRAWLGLGLLLMMGDARLLLAIVAVGISARLPGRDLFSDCSTT